MKNRIHSSKPARGSALILAAILAVAAGATLVIYLLLIQGEYTTTARSQTWNCALVMAEAGIEDGLALVNKNLGSGLSLAQWADTAVSVDNWTKIGKDPDGNDVYQMTRVVDPKIGEYTVNITNRAVGTNPYPSLLAVGSAYWNLPGPSSGGSNVVVSFSGPAVRKVFVQTVLNALVPGTLTSKHNMDFKGNNVTIDSFNSSDPQYSDWQTYFKNNKGSNFGYYPFSDPGAKRTAHGDVASQQQVIVVGDAQVYGHLITGPNGYGDIGPQGSVGNTNWIGPDPAHPLNKGLEPGWAQDDMNVTFNDVILPTPPSGSWEDLPKLTTARNIAVAGMVWLAASNKYVPVVVTNRYFYEITNRPGNTTNYYKIDSKLQSALCVNASNVVLYLPNGLSFKNAADKFTVNTNAQCDLYLGADVNTGGQGSINNGSMYALNFCIYGLPSCLNITLGGNAVGSGFVYAPEADLNLSGGGASVYDVVGAFVANNITINGHYNFHYDEALRIAGPSCGYVAAVWQEVQ